MNTKTRKIIAMILGLALTISLFGGAAVFAAGTVNVAVTCPATVVNGQNIVVTGAISNLVGVTNGIVAYSVKITYDAAKFTYVSSASSSANGTLDANNVAGTLYLVYLDNYASNTPVPLTAGNIFTATFTATATGAATFAVAGIDGTDDFVDTASTVAATYGTAAPVTVQDNAPTAVSIAWKTQPTKTLYCLGKTTWNVGEDLDLAGGAITVTYSNASTADFALTDGAIAITGYNKATQTTGVTTQTVTVKYGAIATGVTYTVQVVKIGDTNNNGSITSGDALQVLQKSTGKITLTPAQTLAGDSNRSSTITSGDALKILQFSTGKITTI
jgi:hypothetical protein